MNPTIALGALALLTLGACGKPGEASTAGAPAGGASKGAPAGASKGSGAPQAIVLGANDVALVQARTIEASILISGDLKPIEEIAVRSRVDGDVVQVLVREGDRVSAGQLLARFENSVQEGDRASANADRESANADVANAQWNADQSEELFKAGAIPERDLRSAQQTLAASQARLAAAEARLRASSQTALDTRIVAPTTGVIAARSLEVGERVTRGATLFSVVRNDVLELEAAVPARQANELKVAQVVRFATAGRQLEGKIARIAPIINASNRSITVYIQVPNRDGAIKGNSFATGRIIGQSLANTLSIPNSAVRQSARGDQPFVYRIEGGKVQQVEVQLGVVDETVNMTQVLSGLNAGDQIVVGNLGALGRGMEVRVMSNEAQPGRTTGSQGSAGSAGSAPAELPASGVPKEAGAGGSTTARADTTKVR
ncbi:MAG: efflux RND transporter periplasmic adaptor subunit [Gemmatimonadetes bacterium]|nr:efflux RND transporter periplasmic adaptor subunit [Gemmatimonadota bacterium]